METLYSTIYYSKYFIELNIDKSSQYVALWTHKRHPIARPKFYEYFNRNWSCYKGFLLYLGCCKVYLYSTLRTSLTSWVRVVLDTTCLGYESSWVRVVSGTSCPGYELSWVRVVLGTSCLGYELSIIPFCRVYYSSGINDTSIWNPSRWKITITSATVYMLIAGKYH